MSNIQTSIIINVSKQKVWQELTNFNAYPHWNPFLVDIQGKLAIQEQLRVTIQPLGKKSMVFKPKIISLIEEQELIWLGRLVLPGVFDGRHQFSLTAIDENTTKLNHNEVFSGLLKDLIFSSIKESTLLGFQQMNNALKQRCES